MADAICSKCDVGWVIHSHDKHCGYCGCKVFDFAVKWEKEPLIYEGDGADIHDLTILIENNGAYPITFQPIQTTRDNTILFPQANGAPFKVEAGQSYAVPIQVNQSYLAQYAGITVRAQDAPSNFESEKSLPLQALQRPEFKLTPNPVVVRHRKGTAKVKVDLRLEVLQSRFTIERINLSQNWIIGIRCKKGPHEEGGIANNVHLDVDCNQLNDESNVVKLSFELLGFSQPIEKQIQIQRKIEPEPPKLFVPSMNLEITQDRKKTHTLTLQNRGERQLRVQNIVFNSPSNLVQLQNVEYPINIEGEEHQNVEMLISADGIEPGPYPVNFTIKSNCEEAPEYEGVMNVRVNKLEEYPHYLAIDFGTTNSCCAYLDLDTFEPKLIPLDSEANPPEIMPSTIVYPSNPTDGKTHHIGNDANKFRASEIDGPYYISSVKRWLGYRWNRQFHNNQKLQPPDVVTDILKHIIGQAEKYLDTLTTQSKITKCVITHPTIFSSKQRKDLELAFKNIGISALELIDEASAASLGTISQRKQQGDYRLLVYDFGGGTIDIVLSQIICQGNDITIEPLGYGGNSKYGGDDVTQAIVDFVLDELEQRIKKEEPEGNVDIPYLNPRKVWQPSASENQKKDRATRLNTPLLYNSAEEMKKQLSDQDEVNRDFPLSVVVGDDVQPLEILTEGKINVSISTEQLKSLIADKLYQTFADIDTMIRENGKPPPKIVILAGQSSKMPMVKKMMEAHFQTTYKTDVEIHLNESPKECVAIGALRYGMTYSLPAKVWIDIINFRKTHSSIGIMQADVGQKVFEEIIPKGKLIPNESSGITNIPLHTGETYIDVREHFGKNDELSLIDGYTLTLPENIPREALRDARLEMAVEESGEITVVALVDGKEYKSKVEKKEPAFVNEI